LAQLVLQANQDRLDHADHLDLQDLPQHLERHQQQPLTEEEKEREKDEDVEA
jgi:hypothetical protein